MFVAAEEPRYQSLGQIAGTGRLGSFTVNLLSDSNGNPGALLEVFGVVSDAALPSSPGLVDVGPGAPIKLAADTRYWVSISGDDSGGFWMFDGTDSGTGTQGEFWFNESYGSAQPNTTGPYQMLVTGTAGSVPVPEPASLTLLAAALLALGAARRRR